MPVAPCLAEWSELLCTKSGVYSFSVRQPSWVWRLPDLSYSSAPFLAVLGQFWHAHVFQAHVLLCSSQCSFVDFGLGPWLGSSLRIRRSCLISDAAVVRHETCASSLRVEHGLLPTAVAALPCPPLGFSSLPPLGFCKGGVGCCAFRHATGGGAPNTCIGGSGTRACRPVVVVGDDRPEAVGTCLVAATRSGQTGVRSYVPLPLHLSPYPTGCAPNTCIGGSGTARGDGCALLFLLYSSAFFVPLARGCMLLLFLALVRLLVHPVCLRRTPLGRLMSTPLLGRYGGLTCPLGAVARPSAVLAWPPTNKPKVRPARWGLLSCACSGLLMALQVPQAVPMHAVAASAWFFCPAGAMGRPPTAADASVGPPSAQQPLSFSPDELTTYVGTCDAGPSSDSPSDEGVEAYWSVARLEAARNRGEDSNGWLGVTVYTPHYKPVSLAVRPGPAFPLQDTLDRVTESQLGVPPRLFDMIVPLRPQRDIGYASLIRFSSNIHRFGGGEGLVAVAVDLTRTGGTYFATTLPKRLAYQELLDFLIPLTSHHDEDVYLYVGCRSNPWPSCALVELRDGDVVTMVFGLQAGLGADIAKPRFADLFQEGRDFATLRHMPVPDLAEGVCVLYRDQRFCFLHYRNAERDVVHLVTDRLRLSPNAITMCSFPIADLDVQDNLCSFLVAVQDTPAPSTCEAQQLPVRHVFVLLDFRPLGLKPRFVHTSLPALHIPSLASRFEIVLAPARVLGVYGGTRVGDDVHVDGNCTLVFFADEAPPPASVSPGSAQADDSSDDTSDAAPPEVVCPDHDMDSHSPAYTSAWDDTWAASTDIPGWHDTWPTPDPSPGLEGFIPMDPAAVPDPVDTPPGMCAGTAVNVGSHMGLRP